MRNVVMYLWLRGHRWGGTDQRVPVDDEEDGNINNVPELDHTTGKWVIDVAGVVCAMCVRLHVSRVLRKGAQIRTAIRGSHSRGQP